MRNIGITLAAIAGVACAGPAPASAQSGAEADPSALPRVTLAELLPEGADPPEAWLVQDGAAGWTLIEDATAAAEARLGPSPFLLPPFGPAPGSAVVPILCRDGMTLIALSGEGAQTVLQDCTSPASARPDLSALTALGRPVELYRTRLASPADLEAFEPDLDPAFLRLHRLEDAPTAVWGVRQELALSLPWVWHPFLSSKPEPRTRLPQLAARLEDLGLGLIEIRIETAVEHPRRAGAAHSDTVPVIATDTGFLALDGLSRVERFHLLFTCVPRLCDGVNDDAIAALLPVGRDLALLDEAIAAGRPVMVPRSQTGGRPPHLQDLLEPGPRSGTLRPPGTTFILIYAPDP